MSSVSLDDEGWAWWAALQATRHVLSVRLRVPLTDLPVIESLESFMAVWAARHAPLGSFRTIDTFGDEPSYGLVAIDSKLDTEAARAVCDAGSVSCAGRPFIIVRDATAGSIALLAAGLAIPEYDIWTIRQLMPWRNGMHVLQSPVAIATEEQTLEIERRYATRRAQFPRLLLDDPIARILGARLGDVVLVDLDNFRLGQLLHVGRIVVAIPC